MLKIKFTAISRKHFQAINLSVRAILSLLFLKKVTSKSLPLLWYFVKSHFCWQSAEIWLPYLLDSIYTKWLALNN